MLLLDTLIPLQKTALFASIALLAIVVIVVARIVYVIDSILRKDGHASVSMLTSRFGGFGAMSIAAGVIIAGLIYALENGGYSIKNIFFVAFPYVASVIFIIGSIYRYRSRSFQVSSLSTQFLEGKKLFWGSQLFHWGILFLFFGHLTAFLFPNAVIAWNGVPVRLLILEVSAFAFGLLALTGLAMLIYRRLTTKRVLVVTNNMDLLVYIVLAVQILSGLGVAYFARWGSSWFASVLTPYLWSLFKFNPRIDAVVLLPWFVQVHIISAFFIIAIIPFTRFIHFLVVPLDYLWRGYQLVLWNSNHRNIRNSKAYFSGKLPRNN